MTKIVVSLFPSKYHYKIVKRKFFISIKHDLIIGRDMPETRHQKFLKNWISRKLYYLIVKSCSSYIEAFTQGIFNIFGLKENTNFW